MKSIKINGNHWAPLGLGLALKSMETLETKNSPSYIACGCGKKYRSRSGLYKHQQKCSFNDKEDNEKVADDNKKVADPSINSSTIMALLKKLGEKDKQIAELQKTVQPTFTNTNNITINLFLNEVPHMWSLLLS